MNTLKMHRKYGIVTNFLDTMLEHEVEIQEGETKLDACRRGLKELDQIAADLRKEAHPHLYQETTDLNKKWVHAASEHMQQMNVGPTTLPTISKDKERIEIAIDNAETIADLQLIKDEAWSNGLSGHYIHRFNELNNGRPSNFTEGLE